MNATKRSIAVAELAVQLCRLMERPARSAYLYADVASRLTTLERKCQSLAERVCNELHRVSVSEPVVVAWGVGTVVDVGRDHDGYCGDWVRLRVLHGTYAFGEIVLCRTGDVCRTGIRIFEVTPPRDSLVDALIDIARTAGGAL